MGNQVDSADAGFQLEKCYAELNGIKIVDNFFDWQLLCNLTEAQVIGVNNLDDWAALGPSAVKAIGLKGHWPHFPEARQANQLRQCLTEVV